jgi:hypothetical protein
MGLFDSVVGSVLNNMGGNAQAGGGGDIMQMVMGLMQQNGGLAGLVEMFNKSGLSQQAASWVGTGENLPISADQISKVLGSGQLAELAGKFGIDPAQLSGGPGAIPAGSGQPAHAARPSAGQRGLTRDVWLSQGLNALTGKLFG